MSVSSHKLFALLLPAGLSWTIGLAMGIPCCAGLVPLHAWTYEYHEGRFVFVMVPTDEQYQEEWDSMMDEPWDQAWEKTDEAKKARRLSSLYPKNGLYLNDGSYKLVWQLPSWTSGAPYLSANGRFAVFPGWWSGDSLNESLTVSDWRANVANFVVYGAIVASYNFRDLIGFPWLKHIVTRQFLNCEKESFDADALTYSVTTSYGEEIVFDVTTGQIIRHYRPVELTVLAVTLFGASSVAVYFLWQKRRRSQAM